jgi:hypothetical protein
MKKLQIALVLNAVFLSHAGCYAAETLNPEQYMRQRGWRPLERQHIARSPSQDIAPVQYYEKGNSVPSCGLITAAPSAKGPNFIGLVSSDPGVDYPQCINIVSMVPFKLQNRDYIAVEYVSRDTREDFYRSFHYVYWDALKGYITDPILTEAVPDSLGDVPAVTSTASKTTNGVTSARAAYLARTFPQWRFLDRDFISDKTSSFSIMEDKKMQQCHFVVEAGAMPITLNHEEFSPGTKCVAVLASSRLEKAETMFYLAMFKSDKGNQVAAITSVSPDGKVTAEKALSDAVNRSGATKDMKTAKSSLSKMLR